MGQARVTRSMICSRKLTVKKVPLLLSIDCITHAVCLYVCIYSRLDISQQDWKPYEHFDTSKNYTRNLVATDHATYTVLVLCWNPHKESPIHDHPCDGCWVRVLQGSIQECRYRSTPDGLTCYQDEVYSAPGVTHIDDTEGYHKIGNAGGQPAVTLHVYSPPFQSCRLWMDEKRHPVQGRMHVLLF
jgi:predicted metal-dependent enzyme (double-stranded beta helix superfamily)